LIDSLVGVLFHLLLENYASILSSFINRSIAATVFFFPRASSDDLPDGVLENLQYIIIYIQVAIKLLSSGSKIPCCVATEYCIHSFVYFAASSSALTRRWRVVLAVVDDELEGTSWDFQSHVRRVESINQSTVLSMG
jgi:hypothetical protein